MFHGSGFAGFVYTELMHPTRNLLLILADKPRTRTELGLYLQEEWKTLPHTGTVQEVGPLVTDVKVGDRVLFERYASIILEGDNRLCQESHVLAIIKDESQE